METKVYKFLGWFLVLAGIIGLILYGTAAWAQPADWTLQGVASYAESLVASSSGSADATKLQGRDVDTATPTDGQVLSWDSDASKWSPADSAGGSSIPSVLRASNWGYVKPYNTDTEAYDVAVASDGRVATVGDAEYGLFGDGWSTYGATGTYLFSGVAPIDFIAFSGDQVKTYIGTWTLATDTVASWTCGCVSVVDYAANDFQPLYYLFSSNACIGSGSRALVTDDDFATFYTIDFNNSTYFVDCVGGSGGDCVGLTASGTVCRFNYFYLGTESAQITTTTPRKIAINARGYAYDCLTVFDDGSEAKIFKASIGNAYDGGTVAPVQVATPGVLISDIAYCGNGIYVATRFPDDILATDSVFIYSSDYGDTWAESDMKFDPDGTYFFDGSQRVLIAVDRGGRVILTTGYNCTMDNSGDDAGKPR